MANLSKFKSNCPKSSTITSVLVELGGFDGLDGLGGLGILGGLYF